MKTCFKLWTLIPMFVISLLLSLHPSPSNAFTYNYTYTGNPYNSTGHSTVPDAYTEDIFSYSNFMQMTIVANTQLYVGDSRYNSGATSFNGTNITVSSITMLDGIRTQTMLGSNNYAQVRIDSVDSDGLPTQWDIQTYLVTTDLVNIMRSSYLLSGIPGVSYGVYALDHSYLRTVEGADSGYSINRPGVWSLSVISDPDHGNGDPNPDHGHDDEHGHAPVPEPSTLLLFSAGIAGLAFWRKRK